MTRYPPSVMVIDTTQGGGVEQAGEAGESGVEGAWMTSTIDPTTLTSSPPSPSSFSASPPREMRE